MLMQDGSRSSHEEGQPHLIGQLQEIFPEQTHENMQRALLVNNDLTGAIDYLLNEDKEGQSKTKGTVEVCYSRLSGVCHFPYFCILRI